MDGELTLFRTGSVLEGPTTPVIDRDDHGGVQWPPDSNAGVCITSGSTLVEPRLELGSGKLEKKSGGREPAKGAKKVNRLSGLENETQRGSGPQTND